MSNELIVLSAPSIHNPYYSDIFFDIIKFQINYAKLILGKNSVIVLADKDTISYLTGGHPDVIEDKLSTVNVLEANVGDIWIRDFGTIRQTKPVGVGYKPEYEHLILYSGSQTKNTFLEFLKKSGIKIVEKNSSDKREDLSASSLSLENFSDFYIDGGNVVEDFNGNAISTDRFNPKNSQIKDRESAVRLMKNVFGYSKVVIISQLGDIEFDTTGHADMMVSFIDENTVAYRKVDSSKQNKLVAELKAGLGPKFKLVELPSYYYYEKDPAIQFSSGCGIHVNAMTTRDFIYMPTFGHDPESQSKGYTVANDEEVYEIMCKNTKKQVVKVPVPYKVCILGGSVRCLSMQIEGPIADHLMALAARSK